jgi:hypothetical protein
MSSHPNAISPSEVPGLLANLQRERFYGKVSFDLRDGEVTLIRTERTQLVNTNKSHNGVNRNGQATYSTSH